MIKKSVIKKIIVLILFLLGAIPVFSQRVFPLVSGITVDSILSTKPGATKIAMDKISGHLFYTTQNGNIYEVFIPVTGNASDTLRYTSANHGITNLQGLYFLDSTVFLCGNVWASTNGIGKVVKGVLKPNGTRNWIDVVTTNTYQTSDPNGDHGFAGVNVDPAGNFIYVSSGARTHLGEIRTNSGAWPGRREVPLTCRIFKFPVTSVGITLPNDSLLLNASGYIFASGTRNAYDMGWSDNNTLFAIDNSGERDDPEELNWLRAGKHYGYPWRMGGNSNPLRVSPYIVNNDPMVNHSSYGYVYGWFNDDPTFPVVPGGTTFTEPVRNYGAAADFYRDSITGKVKKASSSSNYITTFTSHRSPLGLTFDKDSMLAGSFRGNAFVLSFMPGGDSLGYTPLSPWGTPCPFVDPSRELIQMKLTYNLSIDNYTMTTSNIAKGFYLPVDAELSKNQMYVIENGGDIWRINFPLFIGIQEYKKGSEVLIYPNPNKGSFKLQLDNDILNGEMILYNSLGQKVHEQKVTKGSNEIKTRDLTLGLYHFALLQDKQIINTGKLVIE